LAELMGALPTTVQMPELAQAFSTGMVHAMITSPTFAVDTQGWDFVEYMYLARAMVPKDIVLVNRRAFRRLDEDLQAALLEAGARAEARGWEMSAEETEVKTRILAEKGMKVREVSPAFRDELLAIGATMTEEWVAKAGADGEAVVEAFRAR
jgi:TRAP-type C4-dicarboxylate transport system substrate-binding protein